MVVECKPNADCQFCRRKQIHTYLLNSDYFHPCHCRVFNYVLLLYIMYFVFTTVTGHFMSKIYMKPLLINDHKVYLYL